MLLKQQNANAIKSHFIIKHKMKKLYLILIQLLTAIMREAIVE